MCTYKENIEGKSTKAVLLVDYLVYIARQHKQPNLRIGLLNAIVSPIFFYYHHIVNGPISPW